MVSYQFSLLTSRPAAEILDEVAKRNFAGVGVDEQGPSYVVLKPRRPYRYGGDVAAALAVAIVLVSLALAAANVLFIMLLVLAPLPAVPLYLDNRPMLALSATTGEDGITRVTVHGQASAELAAALDAYLSAMPPVLKPSEEAAPAPTPAR